MQFFRWLFIPGACSTFACHTLVFGVTTNPTLRVLNLIHPAPSPCRELELISDRKAKESERMYIAFDSEWYTTGFPFVTTYSGVGSEGGGGKGE